MLSDDLFQCHTVRAIKIMSRRRIFAEVQHFTEPLAADSVGQIMPVPLQAVLGASLTEYGLKAGVPVQDRTASIKRKRADIR